MIRHFKPSHLMIIGGLLGSLVGTLVWGLTLTTKAQDSASQEQKNALHIVTQLTARQKSFYQQNNRFNTDVKKIAKELELTLSPSFNYGIRTGIDSAYIYVMPAKTPLAEQLKSYIGAVFINPNDKSQMRLIICENTKLGRYRPADPKFVSESQPPLQCGDNSVAVSLSEAQP
jgi:hypothetical protein